MTEETSAGNEDISVNTISVDLAGATIALQDEEDNDSVISEDNNSLDVFPNSVVPANTNIRIEGSSDVVIGTVAQFHGPVTIYQNTHNNAQLHCDSPNYLTNGEKSPPPSTVSSDARLVATESLSGNTFSNFGEIPFVQKKIPIIPLIVCGMFISICLIVGLSAGLYMNSEESPLVTSDGDSEDIPLGDGNSGQNTQFKPVLPSSKHKFIPRAGWNAHKPVFLRPMKVPVKYVIISHTAGQMCESFSECAQTMRNIQDLHVKNESPDIGYNFVIGGDENIYEGRGWDNHNFHMALDTIGICFTGNFIYDRLTPGLSEAALELLQAGVEQGKLTADYKLVAHNQTYNTESPGPNIFRLIKNWPHYYADLLQDTE